MRLKFGCVQRSVWIFWPKGVECGAPREDETKKTPDVHRWSLEGLQKVGVTEEEMKVMISCDHS